MSKGRGHNAAGRSAKEARFVQIHHWILESPAARALSGSAFKVLVYMAMRHNGTNNGKISFGARSGCFVKQQGTGEVLDVSMGLKRSQISIALQELQRAGFIACEKESQFRRDTDFSKGQRLVRDWRLTWLPYDGALPSKEFMTVTGNVRPKRHRKIKSSVRHTGQLGALQSGIPDSTTPKVPQKAAYSPAYRTMARIHSPAYRTHILTIPSASQDVPLTGSMGIITHLIGTEWVETHGCPSTETIQ